MLHIKNNQWVIQTISGVLLTGIAFAVPVTVVAPVGIPVVNQPPMGSGVVRLPSAMVESRATAMKRNFASTGDSFLFCRGGGSNGFGYNTFLNYRFIITFDGFQHAGPQHPQFGLAPGQCGFNDDKSHNEKSSLCFNTGSIEKISYLAMPLLVEMKTTPSVVGELVKSNHVFRFSVRAENNYLVVNKIEGPL